VPRALRFTVRSQRRGPARTLSPGGIFANPAGLFHNGHSDKKSGDQGLWSHPLDFNYDPHARTLARCISTRPMSHDTWLHRAVRGLVRPLADSPVTPNDLTTARLVTGIGAAAGFSTGDPAWTWIAAGLFLLSMLCDRADGELARVSGKSSRFGHFYDIITDAVCDTAVLAGIGIGLRNGAYGVWAVPMGIAAGVSVAWIFYMIMRMERHQGQGSGAFSAGWGFDPDDAMVLIPLAMVTGFGEALLLAAAICAPAATVIVYLNFRRRRVRANASGREPPKPE
jgi:phosphatidylglycerophosphate synthase